MSQDLYPSRYISEPTLTQRPDPVLYRNDFSNAPISEDQLRQYERDGYLLLPELFSPEEVQKYLSELERMQQDDALLQSEQAITEPTSNALRSVFRIHRDNKLFNEVAADPRIADIARFILGDEIYVHQSRLNFKPGFSGREFYWHSDFETWHAEDGVPRMRMLSASILLTDNTEFNGSLMVMPGSHREFIGCVGETPDKYYQKSLKDQTVGTPDHQSLTDFERRFGLRSTAAKAGSVLLFDCNLMHGSNSNITASPRSNLFYVYNAVSNLPVAPFAARTPRPDFLATRAPVEVIPPTEPSRRAS